MQSRTSLLLLAAVPLAAAVLAAGGPTAMAQDSPPAPAPAPAPESVIERDGQPQPQGQPEGQPQPTGTPAKPKTPPRQDQPSFFSWPLIVMLGGFFLLYLWMGRGKKKEQRRRRDMLESLKKGDKVVTIGGVIGTVMEVKPDEVTVKTDESGNVRMKFARWSIRGVGEAAKAESAQQAQPEQQRR